MSLIGGEFSRPGTWAVERVFSHCSNQRGLTPVALHVRMRHHKEAQHQATTPYYQLNRSKVFGSG